MLIGVSSIMGRIAEELAEASFDVETVERVIGSTVAGENLQLQAAYELQLLDRLRQHLSELSLFARMIAPQIAADVSVDVTDALASVRLGELQGRLGGRSSDAAGNVAASGDCELL